MKPVEVQALVSSAVASAVGVARSSTPGVAFSQGIVAGVDSANNVAYVVCDGSTVATAMHCLSVLPVAGARVGILMYPPAGAVVLGTML